MNFSWNSPYGALPQPNRILMYLYKSETKLLLSEEEVFQEPVWEGLVPIASADKWHAPFESTFLINYEITDTTAHYYLNLAVVNTSMREHRKFSIHHPENFVALGTTS